MNKEKFIELYECIINNTIIFFKGIPLIKKYKINKIKDSLKVIDLSKIKEIKRDSDTLIEKNNVLNYNNNKNTINILNNFLKIMSENFHEEDLKNMYKNIICVLIRKYFSKYNGEYNPKKNIIKCLKFNDKDSIYHELLHMASNDYADTSNSLGFQREVNNFTFGYGLNEGYTELLNKRYFNSDTDEIYTEQTIVCEYLEQIVGRTYMEKFYLNANILGLINSLKKYYKLEEIERFITAVDFTLEYMDINKLADYEMYELYCQYEIIISFILKGYCKKIVNQNIDQQELEMDLNNYFKLLIDKLKIDILPDFVEEMNIMIKDIFNKNIKINLQFKKM